MGQHTSSEVTVITVTKHLKKNTKVKRGTSDKLKTITKLILPIIDIN